VAGVFVLATASGLTFPAFAKTDSFSWNGLFSHRLDSRTYYASKTGTHTIAKTEADCPGPGSQFRVRLVRNVGWASDQEFPWKKWNCTDDDQSRSWISERIGHFHLTVEKNDTDNTSTYWYVKGKTAFPIKD
jgi:hypothetical protein